VRYTTPTKSTEAAPAPACADPSTPSLFHSASPTIIFSSPNLRAQLLIFRQHPRYHPELRLLKQLWQAKHFQLPRLSLLTVTPSQASHPSNCSPRSRSLSMYATLEVIALLPAPPPDIDPPPPYTLHPASSPADQVPLCPVSPRRIAPRQSAVPDPHRLATSLARARREYELTQDPTNWGARRTHPSWAATIRSTEETEPHGFWSWVGYLLSMMLPESPLPLESVHIGASVHFGTLL
jgi:hypothetical protein